MHDTTGPGEISLSPTFVERSLNAGIQRLRSLCVSHCALLLSRRRFLSQKLRGREQPSSPNHFAGTFCFLCTRSQLVTASRVSSTMELHQLVGTTVIFSNFSRDPNDLYEHMVLEISRNHFFKNASVSRASLSPSQSLRA